MMTPKFTAISYGLSQAMAAFVVQAIWAFALTVPWVMEYFLSALAAWQHYAQVGYDWIGEVIGFDEFMGMCFIFVLLFLSIQLASYAIHQAFNLVIWWWSRHGNMDSRLFEKRWDHRPVVQEAAHGGGELVIKLTKDLPYIVMIWITTQPDGMMTKATPILVGFGYRDGQGIRTAGHCLNSAVKVFISKVGDDRCVEVHKWTSSLYEDDAYLDCPNQCAVLGIRKAPMKFPKPGMSCDVLTYNKEDNTFYMTHTTLMTRRGDSRINDDPRYVYTMSNTHGGDSGLPVLQSGGVIATHIGSFPAGKCNGHFIPVSAFKAYVPSHISRDVAFSAVTPDGVITESPVHTGGRAEGDMLFEEISRKNAAEDEFYRRKAAENESNDEAEALRRQRGEHQDAQGFRQPKKSRKDLREDDDRLLNDPNSWANMELETRYNSYELAETPLEELELMVDHMETPAYKKMLSKSLSGKSEADALRSEEARHSRVLAIAAQVSDEHVANIAAKTTDRALSKKLLELLAKRISEKKRLETVKSVPTPGGAITVATRVSDAAEDNGDACPKGLALASAKLNTPPPAQRAGKSQSSTTSTRTLEVESSVSAKSLDGATQKPTQESQKRSKSSKKRDMVKQLKQQLATLEKQLKDSQEPLKAS